MVGCRPRPTSPLPHLLKPFLNSQTGQDEDQRNLNRKTRRTACSYKEWRGFSSDLGAVNSFSVNQLKSGGVSFFRGRGRRSPRKISLVWWLIFERDPHTRRHRRIKALALLNPHSLVAILLEGMQPCLPSSPVQSEKIHQENPLFVCFFAPSSWQLLWNFRKVQCPTNVNMQLIAAAMDLIRVGQLIPFFLLMVQKPLTTRTEEVGVFSYCSDLCLLDDRCSFTGPATSSTAATWDRAAEGGSAKSCNENKFLCPATKSLAELKRNCCFSNPVDFDSLALRRGLPTCSLVTDAW